LKSVPPILREDLSQVYGMFEFVERVHKNIYNVPIELVHALRMLLHDTADYLMTVSFLVFESPESTAIVVSVYRAFDKFATRVLYDQLVLAHSEELRQLGYQKSVPFKFPAPVVSSRLKTPHSFLQKCTLRSVELAHKAIAEDSVSDYKELVSIMSSVEEEPKSVFPVSSSIIPSNYFITTRSLQLPNSTAA
jgi:hypothetical protein